MKIQFGWDLRQIPCAVLSAALMAIPYKATAQVPNAAELSAQEAIRQQERERSLRQQQESTPDVRLERQQVTLDRIPEQESPCFTITHIKLEGDARFDWAVEAADPIEDPAIGKCLGSNGINTVMRRIQNAIVAKGYVTTRVLAPPQDLTSGTLILNVIPGTIRSIRFVENADGRGTIFNALPTDTGDLLNLRAIEQGLENLKRAPTADADIQIAPAEDAAAGPGESDLLISYRQGMPFRLGVFVDDGGSKATGKLQSGVTFSYDNWLTLNDLFYVSLNQSIGHGGQDKKGTHGYTAHYSIPFGYWLIGITAGENRYHQTVAGLNQNYVYAGLNRTAEIKVSRILYRDGVRKTTGWVRGWQRSSSNYIDDTEVLVQHRRMGGWEVGVAHREHLGTATLDTSVAYRRGTGAFGAIAAPEESFGEGTSRLELMTADVQFNAPFQVGSQHLRYSGVVRGQWNHTPLVPQDRFSIGGRYTVRGFDGELTLVGDRGWLIRNDLAWGLGNSGQELYVGLDHGEVGGQSAQFQLGNRLTGAVIGLRGGYNGGSWDVFVGEPIHKPQGFKTARTTTGFNISWAF